jgi:hypothetical protein
VELPIEREHHQQRTLVGEAHPGRPGGQLHHREAERGRIDQDDALPEVADHDVAAFVRGERADARTLGAADRVGKLVGREGTVAQGHHQQHAVAAAERDRGGGRGLTMEPGQPSKVATSVRSRS